MTTAYCLLPTAYCLLPSAYCLLPTAYCLLPTAYCLLPTAYCLLVHVRLPRRSRLPALMNPEPLVRVQSHHALNRSGEARRIHPDVLIVIAGSNQFDRRGTRGKKKFSFLFSNCAGRDEDPLRL